MARVRLRRLSSGWWHWEGAPKHHLLAELNVRFAEVQTSPANIDKIIKLCQNRRVLSKSVTTPCVPSRNKREGKYLHDYRTQRTVAYARLCNYYDRTGDLRPRAAVRAGAQADIVQRMRGWAK